MAQPPKRVFNDEELLANKDKYVKVNAAGDGYEGVDAPDSLPSQTGNAGKFLSTDGTTASWEETASPTLEQVLTEDNDAGGLDIDNAGKVTGTDVATPTLTGTGETPTIVAGIALGLSPTVAISAGTNLAGLITVSAGTGAGVGDVAVVTMANGFGRVGFVQITPANENAAAINFYCTSPNGGASFTIAATIALADTIEYKWAYQVTAIPA